MTVTVDREALVGDFHKAWYDAAKEGLTWGGTTYFGHTCWKNPTDMWLYQELIYSIRPALIIETGTAYGGSALYYAHILDQLGHGEVLSIDLNPVSREYPRHPRINYLGGHSSLDKHVVQRARGYVEFVKGPILISLDSLHTKEHVLGEMDAYSPLVTPGSYMVVEDTNVGPNDVVFPEHGPGPGDAVREWLPKHPEFKIDPRPPARMLYSFHTFMKRHRP